MPSRYSNDKTAMSYETNEFVGSNNAHVHAVVKAAEQDLRELIRQRAEIAGRIGTIRQTIAGLAMMFGGDWQGEDWLGEELWKSVGRKEGARQRGLTKSCRTVLMNANHALGAKEVCEQLQRRIPLVLLHHKDPAASVTTVLNRLVVYGEALRVLDENGLRAWQWIESRTNVDAGLA